MALVLLRLLESLATLPPTTAQALDQDAAVREIRSITGYILMFFYHNLLQLCCEILWFHYCRRHFTRTAAVREKS